MENLRLDEEESMGYTLKALSAAVWCLYHVNSFRDGLMAVVNAGGDADTNAAVACSVLGAKYGFEAIPRCFVMGLLHGDVLRKKELAQQFHVTERSVQRDMESLRCFFAEQGLQQDIVYDKSPETCADH